MAVSVGSPVKSVPSGVGLASLHRVPRVRARGRLPGAAVQTSKTAIWFLVSVPVLSEQMTDAQPRVSTAGRRLMMALRLAMRPTPMASTMVTMAGRPSGIAATARATAVRNMSRMSRCWSIPTPNITAHTPTHTRERTWETSPIFRWRGVCPCCWRRRRPAIFPISESMPVPVTTIFPRPPVTTVPPMTMFFRSAKGVSGGRPLPSRLATAPDSPVIADSSVCNPASHKMRPSAGT